jgi:2-methylcitrate dehydratase PrpD
MKIEDHIVDTLLQSDFGILPEEAVTATKKSIIDTLGVTIAGRKAEGCRKIVDLVQQWGGKKEATVLSYGFKVPLPQASFANGVMARALDLDEVHDMGTVHTSASVIPGALAAAEAIGKVSGKEFIVAVALGIDLIARMSLAPQSGACLSGMAGSYQAGTFGTAAAVGKLFKLNRKQMGNALGIAYSQAAGNSQCYVDGSHTIRVQQGLSASAGALSAILARRGITGAQEFFEGKFGYFNTYHGGKYDREVLQGITERNLWGARSARNPCMAVVNSPMPSLMRPLSLRASTA